MNKHLPVLIILLTFGSHYLEASPIAKLVWLFTKDKKEYSDEYKQCLVKKEVEYVEENGFPDTEQGQLYIASLVKDQCDAIIPESKKYKSEQKD